MFTEIRLTDFKSFVDERIPLAPLTFLVGANASGKSNFLEALRLLHGLTFDMTIAELLGGQRRAGPDPWPGIRGGVQEASRLGTSAFAIEAAWQPRTWRTDEHIDPVDLLRYTMRCRTHPQARIFGERLAAAYRGAPVEDTADAAPDAPPGNGHQAGQTSGGAEPGMRTDQGLLQSIRRASVGASVVDFPYTTLDAGADEVFTALRGLDFLAIHPDRMRDFGRTDSPLGPEGANLSGVLARLCEDQNERRTIVEWLAELCATELRDLDFIRVPELGDVMAILVEQGGQRVTVRSLSDGTLRFLGLLVALRTAPPGSVLLVEEIDGGLHPSRIHLLVSYLEAVARERQVQILATTHSPVVLHALDRPTLMDAVVFARVPEREGTIVRRLGDLPHLDEALAVEEMDRLFETGWLERAL